MTIDWSMFELYIITLCMETDCKTAKDYNELSQLIHESVERAIQDMCMDEGIDDYEPCY